MFHKVCTQVFYAWFCHGSYLIHVIYSGLLHICCFMWFGITHRSNSFIVVICHITSERQHIGKSPLFICHNFYGYLANCISQKSIWLIPVLIARIWICLTCCCHEQNIIYQRLTLKLGWSYEHAKSFTNILAWLHPIVFCGYDNKYMRWPKHWLCSTSICITIKSKG